MIIEHIKKYYLGYIALNALFTVLYTVYIYLGLNSVGMPLDLVKDIDILLLNFVVIIISFIFIVTGIIPLFLLFIYFPTEFMFYGSTILIVLILIYFVIKYFYFYSLHHYVNIIKFVIPSIPIYIFISLFSLFLIILLSLPILSISNSVKQHDKWPDIAKPTLLIRLYQDFSGYPRLGLLNKKKYIIVGENTKVFKAYDLETTIDYAKNISKEDIQLCRNIADLKETKSLALHILFKSKRNKIESDMKYLNITDPIQFMSLDAKNFDIDIEKLKKECTKLLEHKNIKIDKTKIE